MRLPALYELRQLSEFAAEWLVTQLARHYQRQPVSRKVEISPATAATSGGAAAVRRTDRQHVVISAAAAVCEQMTNNSRSDTRDDSLRFLCSVRRHELLYLDFSCAVRIPVSCVCSSYVTSELWILYAIVVCPVRALFELVTHSEKSETTH